jgi:peptidoglycan/LPS O-acetylase OafA/YrhL
MDARGTGRLRELDCLRGVAAFTVLVSHYTVFLQTEYHLPIGPFRRLQGHWAVWLFFLISGYVIFMTLTKTRRPLDFVASRFSRLYPAYWSGVLFTAAVLVLLGRPGEAVSWPRVAANLTMLHEWLGVHSVDGVYWTLVAELAFYAAMLLLFAGGLLGRIRLVGGVWLAAVAAHAALERFAGLDLPEIVRLTLLLRFAGLFVAGMVFYLIHTGRGRPWDHALIAACFLATLAGLASAGYGRLDFAALGVVFATFYLLIYGRLRRIVVGPLVFLGAVSYPLYLIHFGAGLAVIRVAVGAGLSPVAAALLTTGLMLLAAAGISFLVEQPALRYLRDRYAAWKAGPALPAGAVTSRSTA